MTSHFKRALQCTDGAACRQHRRCIVPQSSAPEDGRKYRPKHVELIEITNNKIINFASSWLFILIFLLRLCEAVSVYFPRTYYLSYVLTIESYEIRYIHDLEC